MSAYHSGEDMELIAQMLAPRGMVREGGPAFPQPHWPGEEWDAGDNGNAMGMSLRDWFAGCAIRARWGDGSALTASDAARMAYELADAMLIERKSEE